MMLTASPITRQTVGKTFSIAISVLGAGAVMQLGVIGWAFATRSGPPPGALTAAVLKTESQTASARLSTPAPLDLSANPLLTEPAQTPTIAPAATIPPKPTPVQQKPPPVVEPANRFEEMLSQGRQLRERGDTSAAITKFRETSATDPKSPIPIAELAQTYEKMGYADKAGENWRKIYDMGVTAGVYFSLADAKLKASQAIALKDAVKQAPDAATDAPIEGIAAGATLGLLPVKMEEERDDASAKKFNLHVPIKARPKARVDVKDLVIHVLFYDIVDGQNVVQTSANVNSRWETPPADWSDSDTEELAVEYQLPKADAKTAKHENRKFFGYIVRIYYKQELQAAVAEPDRLAQQYPPPPTLPKETDK
jgi:hypothetical protein